MSESRSTRGLNLAGKLAYYTAPPDERDCRLWRGAIARNGYGLLFWRRSTGAHRLAWEAANGPIPDRLQVLHRCDVRNCVNPDHLFLGTEADNMTDKVKKGRGARGAFVGTAKLTAEQALAIFHASGTQTEIARVFGVKRTTVSDIKLKKRWRHIHG